MILRNSIKKLLAKFLDRFCRRWWRIPKQKPQIFHCLLSGLGFVLLLEVDEESDRIGAGL